MLKIEKPAQDYLAKNPNATKEELRTAVNESIGPVLGWLLSMLISRIIERLLSTARRR